MRVALYARYSSDMQSATSAADQLAALRKVVSARGWTEAKAYTDEGISGAAVVTRPGVRALMRDAAAGAFDVVLIEALDRLSRGQADTARLHELLDFAGVRLETLSSGIVTKLHVGLEGTMNSLFLDELAKKTRRGLIGRVEAGFSGGGHCYGYRIVGKGVLEIDEDQARIVRRIFEAYAARRSCRQIAIALNRDGIPGPRAAAWGANTIVGDRRALDGILHNRLYIGERIFNKRRFRKHPETGRRSSTLNPPDEWIRRSEPHLRIVEDSLWETVHSRLADLGENPLVKPKPPKRLFSGLLMCGMCGGPMWLAGGKYHCSNRKGRGTCENTKIIAATTIEARVLDGVRRNILAPDMIAHSVRTFHAEAEAARTAALRDRLPIERELAEVERRIARVQDGYEAGDYEREEMQCRLQPLRSRQGDLRSRLAAAGDAQPIRLHPKAAEYYSGLAEALGTLVEAEDGDEVRDLVRCAIERIEFIPAPGLGAFELQVHGTLAALLGVSERAASASLGCEVPLGAGIGFEPMTFRL